MRRSLAALALLLVVAACGGDESPPAAAGDTAGSTGAAPLASSVAPKPTPATTAVPLEAYFTALSNVLGETEQLARSCEDDYVATEFDAPEATPEARLETLREIFAKCRVGVFDEGTARLVALEVPPQLGAAHATFVERRHAWSAWVTAMVADLATPDDIERRVEDPEFVRIRGELLSACHDLERMATDGGVTVELPCPADESEQPSAMPVQAVIGEDGWTLHPAGVIDDGEGVELVIVNSDTVAHQPVVADIFAGDPGHLPIRDGQVDLTKSGVVEDADAAPDQTMFGLAWPQADGDDSRSNAPDLEPRNSITVPLLSGTYVIFDHAPGAYEAGEWATLVVVSLNDIQERYGDAPFRAETCDELSEVAFDLYVGYMDEVAPLTPEQFEDSPLASVDDLRFGTLLQRGEELGCTEAERRAAALRVCDLAAPSGSAAALIRDEICAAAAP
jgi:hypothetical protein